MTVEPSRSERIEMISQRLLGAMRKVARQDGWALAVHGTMARDLDVVAVPWIEGASYTTAFIEAMRAAVSREIGGPAYISNPDVNSDAAKRPNGRRAFVIHSSSDQLVRDEFGAHPYIDLSVLDLRMGEASQAFGEGAYAMAGAYEISEEAADFIIAQAWPDYADTLAIAAGSGTDETSEAQAQAEGSQSGPKGIAQGIAP